MEIPQINNIPEELFQNNHTILENILNNSPAIYAFKDSNHRFLKISKRALEAIGKTAEEVLGFTDHDIFSEEQANVFRERERQVMKTGKSVRSEVELNIPSGKKYFLDDLFPLIDTSGRTYGIGHSSLDITDLKEAQQALNEGEERFRILADNISQLAWMADKDGKAFWFNKRWYDYTGISINTSPLEEDERRLLIHHPDFREKVKSQFFESIKNGIPWEDVFPIKGKDGEYRWFLSTAMPVYNNEGEITRWFGTNTDITEQKMMQEELSNSYENVKRAFVVIEEKLKEREVLIKEIHHRTKNNMQIISSLMSIKSSSSGNEEVNTVLKEMQGRIRAIALVHEKLYRTDNLSKIDFRDYIIELVQMLMVGNSSDRHAIKFDHDLEEISVSVDTAIPCGLVITELVMNSLKYAFNGSDDCCLSITLKTNDTGCLEMIIKDNGIGIPSSNPFESSNSLGLPLIKDIVENQLDGTIEFVPGPGTCWKIVFSIKP